MKYKNLLRAISLLLLLTSFVPLNHTVHAAPTLPPVDMFQLPWEQGLAWVALDGFDNGSDRSLGSPHNYLNGGAVDFAPHNNMVKGENTSNFWVTAAAAGTVYEMSKCHLKIVHSNGWTTEYQHLANFQVKLGDVVARNQKLAVIANALSQPVCPGSEPPDIPHLHFSVRPNMVGATFAGWEFKYSSFWNITKFTRDGVTVGLFKPLLNAPAVVPTSTPTPTTVPTATSTPPSGPYVSTAVNLLNIDVGVKALATVSLNNVPAEGYASAEFTCTYNPNLVEVSNIVVTNLFGADPVSVTNVPQAGSFIVAIAASDGNKATTSGPAFTFDVKGLQAGQTALECTARVSQGDNVLTALPSIGTSLNVLGVLPTPTFTSTPGGPPLPTFTPTPTSPTSNWLTFTNATFGFQFMYPPQGQIQADSNDSNTRINNLPIVQPGTNLEHKFMDVLVGQNVTECKSLQVQDPGVTVTINGIPFLKQTGSQGAAGSLFQLVEYSTLRDGVCVNLEFVLQSQDPSFFPTPPPVFDYATETALFDQIIGTYMWLAVAPTTTPIFSSTPDLSATPTATQTSTPSESATPTFTSTSIVTATATPISGAILTGQVIAAKVVTVRLYDTSDTLVTSVNANPDGTFRFDVAAGTYTIVATANGFLRIQGTITLTNGDVRAMPVITLLAGDIDDDNAIDQFDAMTIGMSYNTAEPPGADLNNDGTINVLDLERLAKNYRKTGPIVWE